MGTQAPLVHMFERHCEADVQLVPFAAAQVLVAGLHTPVVHTLDMPVAHTPLCSPSSGIAAPGPTFATQVIALRSQCVPWPQLASSQQPFCAGTQWLLAQVLLTHSEFCEQAFCIGIAQVFITGLHTPDAHTVDAAAHVPSCRPSLGMVTPADSRSAHERFTRSQYRPAPQSPSTQQPAVGATQCPDTHALVTQAASPEQRSEPATAQVLVVSLHRPDAHTAASPHVPPCSPSLGTTAPALNFATQVIEVRSQNVPAAQSPSSQQPFDAGTQWPLVQVLVVHSAAEPQPVEAPVAQVLVATLHSPDRHTAEALNAPHVPSCRPSSGIGEPAGRSATHANVERSQKPMPMQSLSSQQPAVAATQCPETQALVVHCASAVQPALGAVPQVLVAGLHRPPAHTLAALAQVPSCAPSLGIGAPGARSASQVIALWLQCEAWPQSASAQQPVGPPSTQWPLLQLFDAHCESLLHESVFADAQVLVTALHRPPAQTSAALAQVPSCAPSLGMPAPGPRSASHAIAAWLQCAAAPQSASAQQPLAPVTTQWPLLQLFDAHCVLLVQASVFAAPQVLVAALHRPLTQTSAALAQVPSCAPSVGIGAPAGRSASQVIACWLQCEAAPQSASAQQPLAPVGTQWPLLQLFDSHCALLLQVSAFAEAQVFDAALHRPPVHTVLALAQVPPCRPSLGIGAPAGRSASQAIAFWLQCAEAPQSASAQQPPVTTQWPLLQAFDSHWALLLHAVVFAVAQVLLVALHRPLLHTAAALAQVPSCAPSVGIGAPAGRSASQVIAF
ncbi:MAG: hypothetical protein DI536_15230 [Archangium gephyra]|uniref:Uncharacterized protein n=1 Tax=Archangium gephyra TaxID=48 RepID=A0A2W5USS7_9BACT|nr:MAG: hypothetical protein DI536_15230 [Archangium gephyra]